MRSLSLRAPPRPALPDRRHTHAPLLFRRSIVVAGEGRSANRAKWAGSGEGVSVATAQPASIGGAPATPPVGHETPEQVVRSFVREAVVWSSAGG